MLVIRRKDQYNFILARELDEPITYTIAGVDIVSHYKNLEYFYGTLNQAIIGLYKHSKKKNPLVVDKNITPSSPEEMYKQYMEVEL